MKITFYVLSLGYGGAEKVITDLCNLLSENNDVTIKSIYKILEEPAFTLNKKIKIEYLLENYKPNKMEFLKALKSMNFIKAFKEGIKSTKILYLKRSVLKKNIINDKSDIIFTSRKAHNYILGKYGNENVIKIGQEHNDIRKRNFTRKVIRGAKNLDIFMPPSNGLKKYYENKIKDFKGKIVYIPNYVELSNKRSSLKNKNIISVGRLSEEKDYPEMIEVFNIVHKKYPDWKLNIFGDGPEKEKISNKISSLNLKDDVFLKGFVTPKELLKHMEQSSMFLMTSKRESFGIALIEAFSVGLPAIFYDSAEGYLEIMGDLKSGIVVKKGCTKLMAHAIMELITDERKRKDLGKNAVINSHKYSKENVLNLWKKFIKELEENK